MSANKWLGFKPGDIVTVSLPQGVAAGILPRGRSPAPTELEIALTDAAEGPPEDDPHRRVTANMAVVSPEGLPPPAETAVGGVSAATVGRKQGDLPEGGGAE